MKHLTNYITEKASTDKFPYEVIPGTEIDELTKEYGSEYIADKLDLKGLTDEEIKRGYIVIIHRDEDIFKFFDNKEDADQFINRNIQALLQ